MVRLFVLIAKMPAFILRHRARLEFLPSSANVVVVGVSLTIVLLRPRLKLSLLIRREFRVELVAVVQRRDRRNVVSTVAVDSCLPHVLSRHQNFVARLGPENLVKKHRQSFPW